MCVLFLQAVIALTASAPWRTVPLCSLASIPFNHCVLLTRISLWRRQVVLWAETFQRTRRHFFSAAALKRRLLTLYLGVTVFLYVMLILLYSLFLFSKTDSPRMLDAIYILLALLDLLVPLVLLFSWCCMAFIFSGFPIRYMP